MTALTQSPAGLALARHAEFMVPRHLRDLFAADARRAERFSLEYDEIYLDYSKQRITEETMRLLFDLARQADLEGWIRRLFAGEPINNTEKRPVLHMALRSDRGQFPEQASVMPQVRECRERMRALVEEIQSGRLLGASGQPITDVVNIGIGGSDLGPRLVIEALATQEASLPRLQIGRAHV